jgi:hypothetical protein
VKATLEKLGWPRGGARPKEMPPGKTQACLPGGMAPPETLAAFPQKRPPPAYAEGAGGKGAAQ